MTCIISGCHYTLVPPRRWRLGNLSQQWRQDSKLGPLIQIPLSFQAPCCPHPAQDNLPTSYGGRATHNCAESKGGSLPSPMSTPSQPYSSELPICLSLARAPTPHPPGKDLVIFQARQKQRLIRYIHLPPALTASGEPTLHLLTLPILVRLQVLED